MVFDEVHSDLESAGYEVQAVVIPAAAVNAPHGRDRVWFVAYAGGQQLQKWPQVGNSKNTAEERTGVDDWIKRPGNIGLTADTDSGRQSCEEHGKTQSRRVAETSVFGNWENFPTQPPICGGDDGLPTQLDGITFSKWRNESIKAYGNAVVPQVVYQIFKAIEEIDYICK
jgi:DNA (cytosine-5)-methyltransferase 1